MVVAAAVMLLMGLFDRHRALLQEEYNLDKRGAEKVEFLRVRPRV